MSMLPWRLDIDIEWTLIFALSLMTAGFTGRGDMADELEELRDRNFVYLPSFLLVEHSTTERTD